VRAGLLLAAGAAGVAVFVHGVVGYRWMRQQLRAVELPPSALFGDADVGRRVFAVTWHAVTAVFVVEAGALLLMGLGVVGADRGALRLIAALQAGFLAVALIFFGRRLDAVRGMVPPVFAACMTTVMVATWVSGG